MLKRLWTRYLFLLLGVSAVALCAAVLLRELMVKDFTAYIEGDVEDKAYWIQADLEGSYEREHQWSRREQSPDALWALTLGFEMRLKDEEGNLVVDTEQALRGASPMLQRRLSSLSAYRDTSAAGDFIPYPLFLGGRQIGTLELHELQQAKPALFVRRSDRFLIFSVLAVGCLAVLLSILFSRRLTRPINELAAAASAIARGDLKSRVAVTRRDELGGLAETFNGMAHDLEVQEALRRKLIADVAHELRTPLGVMRGELEGMIDGLIPNDTAHIESLHEETGRLRNIVSGIEELNQAEAVSLQLTRRRFAISSFLQNIVERYRTVFEEKSLVLDLVCNDDPKAYGDPEKLSQVVLNLLSNALRATPPGGRVRVSAGGSNEESTITVEDNGSGIKDEDLPFIFERFYHGPLGGLGIGLTIVRELVEAHGGRIEVASGEGQGSTFTVHIPANDIHNSS